MFRCNHHHSLTQSILNSAHTYTNKCKSNQISKPFILFLFCFQNPTVTVLDTMFVIADLIIYAATQPN